MYFSDLEIEAARRLRQLGIPWEPRAGHYVFDETGSCSHASPFQEKVFFILNYDYFMRLVGGLERFKQIMLWLPTWEDLRQILRERGLSDVVVAKYLAEQQAIEAGQERLALYRLVESSDASANAAEVDASS